MVTRESRISLALLLLICTSTSVLSAAASKELDESADDTKPEPPGLSYGFSADAAFVSKYIWRGQRLTDGWSLQPSATLDIGKLSIGVWGNMDLEAVNEGDSLYLQENPSAPPHPNEGLKNHFFEVDFTLSYAQAAGPASIEVGSIAYTFPSRGASLPITVEVYGSLEFADVPFNPSATLYVDVDETGKAGDNGLYCVLGGGHQVLLGIPRLPALEIAGTVSIVNKGFGSYYYGVSKASFHDVSFSLTLPIPISERWSTGVFLNYSALLGDFRDYQYPSARSLYLGSGVSPRSAADTVWGGVNLSLSF